MEAVFELKELINSKGFYARVSLVATPSHGSGVTLKYDAKSPWFSAVDLAVKYFYEKYGQLHKGGLDVVIKEIDYQIVDTSQMVVFFVALKALSICLGIEIEGLGISDLGEFIIPK